MSAFPNLHALAYGAGGQRLSAELRVEAADALERLNRRCDGCKHWETPFNESTGWCAPLEGMPIAPDFACNAHQPLTPAHDKEKP